MTVFLTFVHVIISLLLIVSILLQSSKGGGLAGMFGGGGGGGIGGVFGARGAATFLSKVTMYLGIGFAATSIIIALLSGRLNSRPQSALQQVMQQERASTPAAILPTIPEEGAGSDAQPAGENNAAEDLPGGEGGGDGQ